MTTEETVRQLDNLDSGDNERDHLQADRIILAFLDSNGFPEVAAAYRRCEERVQFYA
jgi:hypothetical protein